MSYLYKHIMPFTYKQIVLYIYKRFMSYNYKLILLSNTNKQFPAVMPPIPLVIL